MEGVRVCCDIGKREEEKSKKKQIKIWQKDQNTVSKEREREIKSQCILN